VRCDNRGEVDHERRQVMDRQTTRVGITLVTGIVAVLGLVPVAGAAQVARTPVLCPDGVAEFCKDTGVRTEPVRAKPQIVPRAATGPYGQQVFRSGRWLME
jgi:hypothetical protein